MVTVDFEDLELYTICNKYRPELKDSPNVKHYLTLEHKYKNDLLSSMGIQALKGGHSKGLPSLSSYPKESVAALAYIIEEAERIYPNEKFIFYHEPRLSRFFGGPGLSTAEKYQYVTIENIPSLPLIVSKYRQIQISFATPLPNWKRRAFDLINEDIVTFMKRKKHIALWVLYFNKRKQPSIRKFEPQYNMWANEHEYTIKTYLQAFLHNVSFQHGSCLLCRT